MCGIAFFMRYGEKKINLGLVREVFEKLEERGTDASGIYYERGIEKKILKAPVKATELFDMVQDRKEDMLTGEESIIILHTRAMTMGTPKDNNNNHPVYSDNFVMVHNGRVTATPQIKEYNYKGEVDSERIVAQIETNGLINGIGNCHGSMAIIIKPLDENCLYLYRNYSPMSLSYRFDDEVLMGASKDEYINEEESDGLDSLFESGKITVMELPAKRVVRVEPGTTKPKILASFDGMYANETPEEFFDRVREKAGVKHGE